MDELSTVSNNMDQLLQQLQGEGVLDEQFQQLLMLQDETNPDFVAEVVELYFKDSVGKLERIGTILMRVPMTPAAAGPSGVPLAAFNELDQIVHQFKGSSASLGAKAIAALCIQLREACQSGDVAACRSCLDQTKTAFSTLQQRLRLFMALEQQRKLLLKKLAPQH